MSRKLVNDIIGDVKSDLDLKNSEARGERSLDPMIDDDFLVQKTNESLEEIQTYINAVYEDYFITYSTTQMESDKTEYELPTDIYMQKIRRAIYHEGETHISTNKSVWPMRRLMNIDDVYLCGNDGNNFKYMLIDRPVTGEAVDIETKLVVVSKPTSDNYYYTLWYIRELASVTSTGDTIDIPVSAMRYMHADIKYKCLDKDVGNPMSSKLVKDREDLRAAMLQSINNKVPDDQSGSMAPDTSHYDSSNLDQNDAFDY